MITPNPFQLKLSSIEQGFKGKSWRSEYIDEILKKINEEREHTRYKPVTARTIAIMTAHLDERDFHAFLRQCRESKKGFGWVFFGALKQRN